MFPSLQRASRDFLEFFGWKKFIFLCLAIIVFSGFLAIEPIFMSRMVAFVENFYHTGAFSFFDFSLLLAVWAGYILVSTVINYVQRYYFSDFLALSFHNYMAKKYVDNAYLMNMKKYLSKKSGSLYKNFDRGTGVFFNYAFFFFKDLIKVIATIVIIFGFLLWFSPIMALLAFSMVPFMTATAYFVNYKTRTKQAENEKLWSDAFGFIGDFLNNMQLGKILGLEKNFKKDFNRSVDEALVYQKDTSRWWSASDMVTTIFVMISRFLVIGYGIYSISRHSMTLAELMLVFTFLSYIYFPLGALFSGLGNLQLMDTRLSEFYEEFDEKDIEDLNTGKPFFPKNGSIEFKNVAFGYSEEKKIFSDLSFSIAAGEKIALVGNTGAGKSTIVNMIFGFWEPDSGKILIDGQDISSVKKSDLRRYLGMVSQDNSLFNVSIRENLLFAKPDATEKEIKSALKKASAEFVYSMSEGLDTVIGERGLKLSGGEKQRISIARIFLQNPEILILDEATSALDNKTEKTIQRSLDSLIEGKTAIIIAHRLGTIKNVDRIFMIEDGEIVETGSYDELIRRGGKFAELADPSRLAL